MNTMTTATPATLTTGNMIAAMGNSVLPAPAGLSADDLRAERRERIGRIRARANVIGRRLAEHEADVIRHAQKHLYSPSATLRHIARRKAAIIRRVTPLVAELPALAPRYSR